jgi:hypothetical protein
MKDFLQGRPLAGGTSNRRLESPAPASHLPPINAPLTHPDSIDTQGAAIDTPSFPESITASGPSEPTVELIPDSAGRIGHIIVTCSCGEKITLQCNY